VLARLARVVLVVALLAGWQAALQHPVEHVDELGAPVHIPGGKSSPDSLCDLLAALTACATAQAAFFPRVSSQYASPSCPECAARVADAPPFLSQGPPAAA
jgi:hypothetical protein